MKTMMKQGVMLSCTAIELCLSGCSDLTEETNKTGMAKMALGDQLYHDQNLSKNRTMACATCHEMGSAMIDPRETSRTLGASLGDDHVTIGDRNAPSAAYASFAPKFYFDEEEGIFVGGQFLDGRAKDLKEQAKGPFLNPVEMMMPDESSVVARVMENDAYVAEFKRIYGKDIFDDVQKAYDAIAEVIAKFERSDTFAPFDSKFYKVMRGEATFTEEEAKGFRLFKGKAQCTLCHPADGSKALFTDFTYDNLGVPVNHALRQANGKGDDFVDNGLYENPSVDDPTLKGAFKVSSLRNVAVTGPYMHNGVFKNLKTVVHFYNTRDLPGAINPETGQPWEKGEVDENKNTEELGNLRLSDEEEDAIVAFLRTLTDEKFEHLMH